MYYNVKQITLIQTDHILHHLKTVIAKQQTQKKKSLNFNNI